MATRFYFISPSALAAPTITPAFNALWGDTEDARRRWCSIVKEDPTGGEFLPAFENLASDEAVATNPLDVLVAQYISPAMDAQTISGNFKGQIRSDESSTDADFHAQIVAYVVSNDGTSVTGVLYAGDVGAAGQEFSTSFVNRKYPRAGSTAITPVVCNAGDRLVLEVGFRSTNALTANRTATLRLGENAGSDLPEDETTATDIDPWVEFDDTITFQPNERRVSQVLVEVALQVSTPERRVSQVFVEIALGPTAALPDNDEGERLDLKLLLVDVEELPYLVHTRMGRD